MTKLIDIILRSKMVEVTAGCESIIKAILDDNHLNCEMSINDDITKSQACFIHFVTPSVTGNNEFNSENYGFFIDNYSNAFFRLPDKKFLYSFITHIIKDHGHKQIGESGFTLTFNPAFDQMRTAYDYFLTQEGRITKGLNRETYIRQLAQQGVTNAEINGLAYPMSMENGPKGETYAMFYTYCPALDQFVSSSLNKGLYPNYYLAANLNYLKQNAKWVEDNGLVPGMLCFEPRSVPEEFFSRYPMLRGARVDHPFRSFKPRYNMTITHPLVLDHYKEMVRNLLKEVPGLGFLTIWTNDSGAGFEYTKSLYVGRNGGAYLVREWKDDNEIARLAGENALRFFRTLLAAGREINPDFRVIIRMESFYGEHDIIWNGLGDGLDVETASLIAKGWEMPYSHPVYSDSKMLNGGSAHHQEFYPAETEKILENNKKGARSAFYLGMGPEVLFAPLMGIPYPKLVWKRLQNLYKGKVKDLVIYGGTFPPEQVPYFVNYEIIRNFQYGHDRDVDTILKILASNWSASHSNKLLLAWDEVELAILNFPNVSTLYNTIGFAWYRIWTRPLVPDIEAVPQKERDYYEDMMCTTPHNPNNVDLARDVLFNISSFEHCEKALPRIGNNVLPHLNNAIDILSLATADNDGEQSVCFDQMIRIKALKAWILTQRNIAAWIVGVHGYLNTQDVTEQKRFTDVLDEMMLCEISNMKDLLGLFDSGVSFIALTDKGETPLMYSDKLPDQIRIKIDLMRRYGNHKPYIDPDYIVKKAGIPSE